MSVDSILIGALIMACTAGVAYCTFTLLVLLGDHVAVDVDWRQWTVGVYRGRIFWHVHLGPLDLRVGHWRKIQRWRLTRELVR